MKIKLMVATHKLVNMPKNNDMYLPILVGAIKNFKNGITFQRDDEGENISSKNPNYNELTALYWAWKNLTDVDAIGLVQYRRYFFKKFKKRNLTNIIDKADVEKLLEHNDLILPKKRHYYIESNYSHYIHAHHKQPLDETRKVIAEFFPDYLASFDKVMLKRSAHMFNMFIMKKLDFDRYCKWLFAVLNNVENRIDINNYSVQEKRVYGYLSELLLDVWIDKNNISFVENRWGMLGSQHLLKKIYYFVLRKFNIGDRKTHF